MSDAALRVLRGQLAAVRAQIGVNGQIRELLAHPPTQCKELAGVAADAPASADWSVFDHTAAVMRVYSLFEWYVGQIAATWLSRLPSLVPKYQDLADRVKRAHREGLGRLLSTLHYRRHRAIDPIPLLENLRTGLSGEGEYALDAVVFSNQERNYKADVLREFFGSLGIEGAWEWIDRHRFIADYLSGSSRTHASIESALGEFVDYRNDAAHGHADDVLGYDSLLDIVGMVEALCRAIDEMVRDRTWNILLSVGGGARLGVVTEFFAQANALVARLSTGSVTQGDIIVLRGPNACRELVVTEIQIDSQPTNGLSILRDTEIGLLCGSDVRVGWNVLKAV